MSILIVSQLSYDMFPIDQWVDTDEDLVLLTSDSTVASYPNEKFAYIEGFPNYMLNETVYYRALELHERFTFSRVICTSEYAIVFAARLREKLGIPGQKVDSAMVYRDKILMKEVAKQKGLKVPTAFARLNDAVDLYEFVQQHGFPLVVKPVDGAGSFNTHILQTQEDVYELLKEGIVPGRSEIETFVNGDLYHIDALVQDGKVVFICASRHLEGNCLGPNGGSVCASYQLELDSPLHKRLNEYTIELVAALDTPKNTTIHCELFHTIDDEIVLCEVASRTGGAKIVNATEQTYGINLFESLVHCQMGQPTSAPNGPISDKLHGYLLVPTKTGTLTAIPDEDTLPTWVKEYQSYVQAGQTIQGGAFSTDHIGYVVVEGETEELLRSRLIEINDWLEERFVYQEEIK